MNRMNIEVWCLKSSVWWVERIEWIEWNRMNVINILKIMNTIQVWCLKSSIWWKYCYNAGLIFEIATNLFMRDGKARTFVLRAPSEDLVDSWVSPYIDSCVYMYMYINTHARAHATLFCARLLNVHPWVSPYIYWYVYMYMYIHAHTHTLLFCARLLKLSSTRASVLTYIDVYICTFENTRTNTLLFCSRLLYIAATCGSVLT